MNWSEASPDSLVHSYIANSLIDYTPATTLPSSNAGLLEVTRSSHKNIGDLITVPKTMEQITQKH